MKEGIIFDTNLYRNLSYNKTIPGTITYFDRIISCEKNNSIISFANPFVILELLSHLSDENDPAFNNCHSAIIALFHHCKTSDNQESKDYP